MRDRAWVRRLGLVAVVWVIAVAAFAVAIRFTEDIFVGLGSIPPLLAIFVIGVREADHWWTRAAALTPAPMAVGILWLTVKMLLAPARASTGYASVPGTVAMLTSSMVMVALLAMGVAALGVVMGRSSA